LEKKTPMIRIRPLKRRKRKGVREKPNSMANERFQCLVAFQRSNVWWPMGGSNPWWLLKGSNAWWPLKGSNAWWPLKGSNA
jgi:hypothetical protein